MSQVQAFRSQSEYSKRTVSQNEGQENPLTSQSIKFYQDPSKDELIQLKGQMKQKEQELLQKNQIIKQLQERCMLVDTYERKIQNLESKATQLEKIIDRLERDDRKEQITQKKGDQNGVETGFGDQNVLKETNKNNSSKNLTSKQKITSENKVKGKQPNKQNRKSSIKMKDNSKIIDAINQQSRSKSKQKSNNKDRKICVNDAGAPHSVSCKNIEQIVSSKCLNHKKQDPLKFQQIEMKFNKMKENIPNSKPRSNKTIEEIYSMVHNRKIRGEQSYVRQINQKLQTIVDESERLSNSGSTRERDLSFSQHSKYDYQWKNEKDRFFQQLESTRPRSDSYTFQSSFMNNSPFSHRPYPETNRESKHVKFERRHQNYRSDPPQDAFTTMDSRKFAKIMNSTNVEDMLRSRKTYSGLELPIKGVYNKTFDSYTDRYTTNKVFWK